MRALTTALNLSVHYEGRIYHIIGKTCDGFVQTDGTLCDQEVTHVNYEVIDTFIKSLREELDLIIRNHS